VKLGDVSVNMTIAETGPVNPRGVAQEVPFDCRTVQEDNEEEEE